nr:MAG TPA: hypothetical protein [Caudoviricetes sp.]
MFYFYAHLSPLLLLVIGHINLTPRVEYKKANAYAKTIVIC